MAETPKLSFSRRGFLKGAGLTAATTVLDTANALARETTKHHREEAVGRMLCRSSCT